MSESTIQQDLIEQDLARTRARMDSRLTDLQARLSPGQILDDLMTYFRGSEGGDFARNLMSSVQNNPMPAALTGIGLAWLMASNPHPQPGSSTPASAPPMGRVTSPAAWANNNEFDRHIRGVEEAVVRQSDEQDSDFHGRVDDARGQALGLVRDARDTAETYARRVQDALAAARQSATEAARNVGDKTSEAARHLGGAMQSGGDQVMRSGQAAQQMAGQLITTVTENPLLLGAIGLAAGALLGALVPQSEQEQEALEELGQRARESAGGLAQEVVNRGASVAKQVLEAGKASAGEEGLTGKSVGHFVDEALKGNLAGSVSEIARGVVKASDEAIRQDGLRQGEQDKGSGTEEQNPSLAPRANEGEGSQTGAREYNRSAREFVETGWVNAAAQEAANALDDETEAAELRRAEEAGKARSHGEDPLLRKQ